MPTIVSRSAAGLPPVPGSIGHRSLGSWAGIKVHHTGGRFSSWKAIHDWQTAGRPAGQRLAYAGYSFGIANGRVTELRGWDRQPAHDHENSTLGVVFGGNFTSSLPSAADLEAFVWFCRLARERTGKRLEISGHRDTWPRGDHRYSTCPGDRLYGHLPTLRRRVDEEDDVSGADVWTYEVPRISDGKRRPMGKLLAWGNHAAFQARDAALENSTKLEALLAAHAGQDVADTVQRLLDQHAERERVERAAELGEVTEALQEASEERVALAELVRQGQSGEIPAEEVVRLIGEKLTAAAEPAGDET